MKIVSRFYNNNKYILYNNSRGLTRCGFYYITTAYVITLEEPQKIRILIIYGEK